MTDREPEQVAVMVAQALAGLVGPGGRRALFIEEVDGQPTHESRLAPALREVGFLSTNHGYLKRL